jgi:hypothetical protein
VLPGQKTSVMKRAEEGGVGDAVRSEPEARTNSRPGSKLHLLEIPPVDVKIREENVAPRRPLSVEMTRGVKIDAAAGTGNSREIVGVRHLGDNAIGHELGFGDVGHFGQSGEQFAAWSQRRHARSLNDPGVTGNPACAAGIIPPKIAVEFLVMRVEARAVKDLLLSSTVGDQDRVSMRLISYQLRGC